MLHEEYEACDKGFTRMTTAAIRRLAVPSPEELIDRARGMVPEIRALAEETERNRNVLPHIIDKIRDAELLRTCRPKEFGGFEYDGETALRIALTISAACASTGWAVNGAVSNGRSIAHFPIEAQREVWGGNEDPFTCACFAPTGTAVPVDGGYVLSGAWSFASGCDASSWVKLGAFITPPGAKPPQALEGAFFLLPIGDCEIVDNWFVCGLAGTGSKDIVVREAFVPAHRVLLFADARSGTAPGAKYHKNPLYRMPLLIHGASMLASTAVGAARGALDAYLEMTRARKTRGALAGGQLPMAEFATIQLRYAEAAAAVESAELILLDRYARHDAEALCGRGDHDRRPHPLPPQPGLGDQARGAGGRGAQRLDRRLRLASEQSGATRVARRQCGGASRQPQLGCRGHDVRPARLRPRAAGAVLASIGRRITPTEGTGRWRKYSVSVSPIGRPCACRTRG